MVRILAFQARGRGPIPRRRNIFFFAISDACMTGESHQTLTSITLINILLRLLKIQAGANPSGSYKAHTQAKLSAGQGVVSEVMALFTIYLTGIDWMKPTVHNVASKIYRSQAILIALFPGVIQTSTVKC